MKVGCCLCITTEGLPHTSHFSTSLSPSLFTSQPCFRLLLTQALYSLAPVSLQLSNPRIPGWGWERRRLEYHACSSLPFQFPLPPPSPGTAAASRDIWVNYCCFISCPWNQTESHPKIHNRTVLYTPCIKWITFCLFLQISPLWLHLKSQSVHEVPWTSSLQSSMIDKIYYFTKETVFCVFCILRIWTKVPC